MDTQVSPDEGYRIQSPAGVPSQFYRDPTVPLPPPAAAAASSDSAAPPPAAAPSPPQLYLAPRQLEQQLAAAEQPEVVKQPFRNNGSLAQFLDSPQPSVRLLAQPSVQLLAQPSVQPSANPSEQPSVQPTVQRKDQPTVQPETQPTARSKAQPTAQPPPPQTMGMPYEFEWSVEDSESSNRYSHQERSDGRVTSGEYIVLLPDGRTQTVTFVDRGHGYEARVVYSTT